MTDEDIQRARVHYERVREESVYTGADMLRLLRAVDDAYFQQLTQAMADRGQAREALRAARETQASLIGLLATLFPASYEPNTADWDSTADWLLIIDLPTGQVAFPYGDRALPTAKVPFNQGRIYDGHTLAERAQRIRGLMAATTVRQQTTAVPKELSAASAGDATRDVCTLSLADAFLQALGDRFLHVRGALTWEWQAMWPHWTTADIYTVSLRIVASDNRLWPEASHDTDAVEPSAETRRLVEDASDAVFRETYGDDPDASEKE